MDKKQPPMSPARRHFLHHAAKKAAEAKSDDAGLPADAWHRLVHGDGRDAERRRDRDADREQEV